MTLTARVTSVGLLSDPTARDSDFFPALSLHLPASGTPLRRSPTVRSVDTQTVVDKTIAPSLRSFSLSLKSRAHIAIVSADLPIHQSHIVAAPPSIPATLSGIIHLHSAPFSFPARVGLVPEIAGLGILARGMFSAELPPSFARSPSLRVRPVLFGPPASALFRIHRAQSLESTLRFQ